MSNAREARQMLRAHRYGALSTLSKKFDGHPFGSICPYLVDHDGSLLILISTLAEHTKNILAELAKHRCDKTDIVSLLEKEFSSNSDEIYRKFSSWLGN